MSWIESDSDIVFRAFCPCFLAHKITEDIRHGACGDFHGEFPSSPQTCVYDSALLLRSGHFWYNAAGAEASMSREVRKIKFLWEKCGSLLLSGALMCRIGMRTLCPCVIWHIMKEFCQHWAVCVCVCVCVSGLRWVCGDKGIPPTAAKYHFSAHWEELPTWTAETSSRVWVTGSRFKGLFWAGCIIYKAFPRTAFLSVSMTHELGQRADFHRATVNACCLENFFFFFKSVPVYIARDERFWFCGN